MYSRWGGEFDRKILALSFRVGLLLQPFEQ